MFPSSSSRVKLNRGALKEVVGIKLVPRRRRVPKSPDSVRAGFREEQEEKHQVPGVTSAEDAGFVPGSHAPVHRFSTGPEKVSDTVGKDPEGQPEEKRVGHPSPSGLTGSKGSLRRAATPSRCVVCKDCKYVSPQKKTPAKKEARGPGQSTAALKNDIGHPVTEHSKRIVKSIDQYPKVILCNIAKKCKVCSHNCGYVLPEVLKTTVVHCFKRDIRAGFRFGPSCLRPKKQKIQEKASAKHGKQCQKAQSERSKATAMCSTPPLSGKSTNSRKCRTSTGDRDVKKHRRPRGDPVGVESHKDKRKKRRFSITEESLPSTPDSESTGCDDAAKSNFIEKEKTSSWMSGDSQSCLELTLGSCRSTGIGNGQHKSCGQIDETKKTDTAQMSSELLCQRNNVDAGEPESFTCQRVRVYCRKMSFSCARTNLSWPFSINSSSRAVHSATACQAEPTHPSPSKTGDASLNQNQSASPSPTNDMLPHAPADPSMDATRQVSPHLNEEQTEERDCTVAPRNGERPSNMSSYASDSMNMEVAPQFTEESLSSRVSETATDSTPSQHGMEAGTVLASTTSVNGPETDSNASTPSPSALGLSDWETATTVSPMSSLLTSGSLSSLLAKVKGVELAEAPSAMTSCCSSPTSSSALSHSCDSFRSRDSFLLLPQDEQGVEEEMSRSGSPPRPHNSAKPFNQYPPVQKGSASSRNTNKEAGCSLSPLLSPVPSCDDGSSPPDGDEALSPSEMLDRESEEPRGAEPCVLDEFTAYEQDILLVDVIQYDPELFENLPKKSLLKLGPTRVGNGSETTGTVKTPLSRIDGASLKVEQRLSSVIYDFHSDSPDDTEEGNSRPWRHQGSSNPIPKQNLCAPNKRTINTGQFDANNNRINGILERSLPTQRAGSPCVIPQLMTIGNGPWSTNPANMTNTRPQKSSNYCRKYFSESLSCGFQVCRFPHVPVEGDEKFCIETVTRFLKNPNCLQKAGAVFTSYYQNNPPGVFFSTPLLLTLLESLLKASMVSDVLTVLGVCLVHKLAPGHKILLALFAFVRQKGLFGHVRELMQLIFKMAGEGLVLSLGWLECVKNTPEFQQTVNPNSPVSVSANHKLSPSAPFPDFLKLAHSIVEIELCTKQEEWRQMGKVFRSVCQAINPPNQVEQISGRIAIALLSESKDKLSLPFATFAEAVFQNECGDSLTQSFFGRIGVSLMLRYHKTHQWAKGRKVVEVLSNSKVGYSTLKGLFGNEDGASRCHLVTVATELFLLSGSVEGALQTLRESSWFLSSQAWPCEPADLDSRGHMLMRLAEKASHRDTLEVLCNLPGIKEPSALIDIARYSPLFKSHLQVCVDRQVLPVASDTVDFMFSKNLAVDHATLQILLHRLGKQNQWLRAREVFRHSLSVGYYSGVSAPSGFMALIVPCRLGEVELALSFEMFIAVNATVIHQLSETSTSCLSIILKRTQSGESEYLSAGSRLLSAACIPQPKLIVRYKAVNSSQEQVFTLDVFSARRWLRHNLLWANEVWTH